MLDILSISIEDTVDLNTYVFLIYFNTSIINVMLLVEQHFWNKYHRFQWLWIIIYIVKIIILKKFSLHVLLFLGFNFLKLFTNETIILELMKNKINEEEKETHICINV